MSLRQQPDRDRGMWWPLLAASLMTGLLIFSQQIYYGIRDARVQAQADARTMRSLLNDRHDAVDERVLALVANRFEHVQWVKYCVDAQCVASYRRTAGALDCDGVGSSLGSVCVRSGDLKTGSHIVARYSLTDAWAATARDLVFLLLLSGIGVVTWAASSRQFRRQIAAAKLQLQHSATRDGLTGLWNRRAFEQALSTRIAAISQGAKPSALLYMDLDGFKELNDTHGHPTGDRMLELVARRLEAAGDGLFLARLGGDEFGALLDHDVTVAQAEAHAKRFLSAMTQPYEVDGITATMGVSIGIAMLDQKVKDGVEALRQADVAMYEVKRTARGTFRHFDERLSRDVRAQYRLLGDLREATRRHQFHLEYQPQVDPDGNLRGVEALLRWHHPHRGRIRPDEYVMLAEQSGLIVSIGDAVIAMACADLVAARRAGVNLPYVSVNVAPRQLAEPDFLQKLERTLSCWGLGPRDLELEVTESSLISAAETTGTLMDRLSKRGFRLAIDDFGTGYSSLSRLVDLPVDKLKIDKSFIAEFRTSPDSAVVAETVIALARKLRLKTVAEGVETAQQVAWLRAVGCELMQGYFFAKPMSIEHLVLWAMGHQDDSATGEPTWAETLHVGLESGLP
jgi:diguanylate cyclase (GGDEF)-like protein